MSNPDHRQRTLTIDLSTGDAWLHKRRLFLSESLTQPLVLLAKAGNRTLLEDDLYQTLGLDRDHKQDRHLVHSCMNRLRKILGRDAIVTRVRVGWVLLLPVHVLNA